MRQRAELLVPHFRRAVTIGNVVNRRKVETEVLAETLDGLSSALFLVDANGQIKHANASGQAMLRAGLILSDTRGKLATADLEGDRVLKEVIAAAATGDAAERTGAALPLRAGWQLLRSPYPSARWRQETRGRRTILCGSGSFRAQGRASAAAPCGSACKALQTNGLRDTSAVRDCRALWGA